VLCLLLGHRVEIYSDLTKLILEGKLTV